MKIRYRFLARSLCVASWFIFLISFGDRMTSPVQSVPDTPPLAKLRLNPTSKTTHLGGETSRSSFLVACSWFLYRPLRGLFWSPHCGRLAWSATSNQKPETAVFMPKLDTNIKFSPYEDDLVSLVDEVRSAILRWDFQELSDAVRRLRNVDPANERQAFARDYWLGTALFHAVLIRNEEKNESAAGPLVASIRPAVAALEEALAKRPDQADCHAMLATLYGLNIQERPLAALRLGSRLNRHRKAAENAQPPSPRAKYLEGVGQLRRAKNTDAVANALDILLNAERLFELEAGEDRDRLAPDWGRSHNWLFIGEAHEKLGRPEQALTWYEKARRYAPNSIRVQEGIKRCQTEMGKE